MSGASKEPVVLHSAAARERERGAKGEFKERACVPDPFAPSPTVLPVLLSTKNPSIAARCAVVVRPLPFSSAAFLCLLIRPEPLGPCFASLPVR